MIIFCTISISSLNPLIASRLDMESEKIIKFFSFLRRTTASASEMAYNSALKMLALFDSLVVDDRQTDGRQQIANVNVSRSRSLKIDQKLD